VATPVVHRQLILDDVYTRLAALKTITPGTDYRHKLVSVVRIPLNFDKLSASLCPTVCVYGGAGASSNAPSSSDNDKMAVTILVYVFADDARFSGIPVSQLLEEVVADVEKAMDGDLSRGGRAFFNSRERATEYREDGVAAMMAIKEMVSYNRRRT